MSKIIKVGVVGSGGYTAGELIRILLNHPNVEICSLQSNSQAGKAVYEVHRDLLGSTTLKMTAQLDENIDVVFLCSGHSKSKAAVEQYNFIAKGIKVIDLSTDFRKEADSTPFVYGLPELQRSTIKGAVAIANPGCFATAIQLSLLPLAKNGLLNDQQVAIHAITGSTGAGQTPKATSHFSWRANNISIYKPFTHQHLAEIHQGLDKVHQNAVNTELNFIPVRGCFTRGIFVSSFLPCSLSEQELNDLYNQYYASHPFVHLSPINIDLKQVVNTNKALIYLQKHDDKLLVVAAIDNLLKGASGQAVQNLNLLFNLPETTGLNLKATSF